MSSLPTKLLLAATLAAASPSAFADDVSATAKVGRMLESSLPGGAIELSDDPVLASFQRMLAHEPNRAAPQVPANFERDPLIEALVLPLLRWSATHRRQATAR